MTPIVGHDAEIAHWVGQRLDNPDWGEWYTAIGLGDQGKIIAGVIYHNYRPPTNMEISIATDTPRWATRGNLRMFFHYPFEQLGVTRLTAITGRKNAKVRRFNERLGFVKEGVLRQAYVDDDAVIYGLLRSECRWL